MSFPPRRILVVCTGNLCRSPFAAGLLAHLAGAGGLDLQVRSRGLGAADGLAPPAPTRLAAAARGFDLAGHRGTQIELADTEWAEEILVMEPWQLEGVRGLDPVGRVTGLWTFLPGRREIPDPYGSDEEEHRRTARLLEDALRRWLEERRLR